jgi:DNA-directed RNA polymerase II subunit RPB1
MGIVQDALLGSYMLTTMDTFITREEFIQTVLQLNHYTLVDLPLPTIIKPVHLWTGKQLMSIILPRISIHQFVRRKDINISCKAALLSSSENYIIIQDGQLLTGRLCKESLGAVSGGIIQRGIKVIGTSKVLEFMSDCQRLVNHWLIHQGFSIGVADCIVDNKSRKQIDQVVKKCMAHADKINNYGKKCHIKFDNREIQISKILTKMHDITSSIIQTKIQPTNALRIMVEAGSKGNTINISQIIGCVGQQSINGRRIYDTYNATKRILSHFERKCDSIPSRGFVENSYITGLSVIEMFFHTMGGREGIVDTSVKTATTGYLQRRLMKALEMLTVEYDYTVRDSYGNVIDMFYGGDSYDASWLEKVSLKCIMMQHGKLKHAFGDTVISGNEYSNFITLQNECYHNKQTFFTHVITPAVYLPVNITTLLLQCKRSVVDNIMDISYIWSHVQELLHWFEIMPHNTIFMRTHIAFTLRSVNLIGFTQIQIDNIIKHIKHYHRRAIINPGEMVGVLAVQSIGEPCTQLTLNTVCYVILHICNMLDYTLFMCVCSFTLRASDRRM